MSNVDAVNQLLTAIHFDRFAEIEARHNADATFQSFRGPNLADSVSIADWHRDFLKDYADCNYGELEYIESGETVVARATISAKGYDWREFTQRVIEVFEFERGGIQRRRMYGMVPKLEMDKPTAAAMTAAANFKGGSASATRQAVEQFYAAVLAGETDAAKDLLDDKAAAIDSAYGIVNGPDAVLAQLAALPRPAFGIWHVTNALAGEKDALVETAIDPSRPRRADWVRMVEGKIKIIETYWMFREIGISPDFRSERHQRRAILPT